LLEQPFLFHAVTQKLICYQIMRIAIFLRNPLRDIAGYKQIDSGFYYMLCYTRSYFLLSEAAKDNMSSLWLSVLYK
jgi:hypothetical protein